MDRAPLGSYFAMGGLPAPHARGSGLNRENLSEAADADPASAFKTHCDRIGSELS